MQVEALWSQIFFNPDRLMGCILTSKSMKGCVDLITELKNVQFNSVHC